MEAELSGTYRVTLVLPAWTVENELTLIPREAGSLEGTLNTLDGNPPVPFTSGRWNKNFFQIFLAVGPGQLELTGRIDGSQLHGVVIIENTPDSLSGTKIEQNQQ